MSHVAPEHYNLIGDVMEQLINPHFIKRGCQLHKLKIELEEDLYPQITFIVLFPSAPLEEANRETIQALIDPAPFTVQAVGSYKNWQGIHYLIIEVAPVALVPF